MGVPELIFRLPAGLFQSIRRKHQHLSLVVQFLERVWLTLIRAEEPQSLIRGTVLIYHTIQHSGTDWHHKVEIVGFVWWDIDSTGPLFILRTVLATPFQLLYRVSQHPSCSFIAELLDNFGQTVSVQMGTVVMLPDGFPNGILAVHVAQVTGPP